MTIDQQQIQKSGAYKNWLGVGLVAAALTLSACGKKDEPPVETAPAVDAQTVGFFGDGEHGAIGHDARFPQPRGQLARQPAIASGAGFHLKTAFPAKYSVTG